MFHLLWWVVTDQKNSSQWYPNIFSNVKQDIEEVQGEAQGLFTALEIFHFRIQSLGGLD